MTDSLYETPKRDDFQSESPIRAFTTWDVKGVYAMGKGFRPALGHIIPYLNAMEEKEGWRLVQILEPASQAPSFVFRQVRKSYKYYFGPMAMTDNRIIIEYADPDTKTINRIGLDDMPDWVRDIYSGVRSSDDGAHDRPWTSFMHGVMGDEPEVTSKTSVTVTTDEINVDHLEKAFMPVEDGTVEVVYQSYPLDKDEHPAFKNDPINPNHYKRKPGSTGRECADIGERLSANGYQILKYCWRLGGKDDPCQELGKAIWYAESEMGFLEKITGEEPVTFYPHTDDLDNPDLFFHERLNGMPSFTQDIARMLWFGYDTRKLRAIIEAIQERKFHMDCGRGLAI